MTTTTLPPQTIPGPKGLPFLGVALDFLKDPLTYFDTMVARYGRLFRLPLGGNALVFLNDAADVEQVLRRDFENFGASNQAEDLLRPLLGRSMPVVADQFYWEQLHSIMLPMFTPKMLQMYFGHTLAATQEAADKLTGYAESGDVVSMYNFAREGVFNSLLRTLFARGIDPAEIPMLLDWFSKADEYVNARNLSGASPLILALPAVREGKRCLRKIDRRVYELLAFRKANRVEEPEDMLDVLLAAKLADGSPLSDKELRDNVVALLFGGQETTPGAITWAFGLLATHPEKRRLMLEEIDQVLEGRPPTFQDLSKLEYTEMVLDEAMRLYPAFPFIGRESLVDTEIAGYPVPKGTALGFVAWTVHRDPRHWPEPDKFIPERHTKAEKKVRAKCALLSFGYGHRRCIGERVGRMEGLLMLAVVSQRFLLDHESGKIPDHKVQMSIKPVDGMPMRVSVRAEP
ncbi:MAG: cytochrome P450 [Caulobacter sp.]|nr:cytochrome P450 [Caulobacter sp.]